MEKEIEKTQVEVNDKEQKKEKKNKYKVEIETLKEEIKALKEAQLRELADVENFKKRMHQERINDRKFASKNLIAELLMPLDQLSKVVQVSTEDLKLKNFLIGFKMINDQLYQVLEQDGLKKIEALNQPFDPNFHYAVEKVSDRSLENGINIEVVQEGYTYKEQIIRPAMVKVNEWSDENGENK